MTSLTKDEYSNTRTRIYRYEGQNGRFMQRSFVIRIFTTYDLWCPQCKEVFSWTNKTVKHLDSGEKKSNKLSLYFSASPFYDSLKLG